MNEEEFLKQLDKRLENVTTKNDLKNIRSDFENVKSTMATKDDLKVMATKNDLNGVKDNLKKIEDDLSVVKVDVDLMKKEWGEKIDKMDGRINDVYNLVDKVAKGIEAREQEFYAREAQVDRKLQTLARKVGVVFENN